MSAQRTIGIGIVGSGLMARTYAETLAKYVRGCKFVAVTTGSRAPQLAQDYGVECESSLESMVARPDIDGLIITTPEIPPPRASTCCWKSRWPRTWRTATR